MLSWLKSLFPGPKRIEDPTFGSLLYMRGYWEGKGEFAPIQEQIEWFVTAGDEGPGEPQYSFFQSACARYAELRSKAYLAIRTAAGASVDCSSLKLVAIDIPASPSPSSTWELSFEGPTATHYAVQFLGWEPSGKVDISRQHARVAV